MYKSLARPLRHIRRTCVHSTRPRACAGPSSRVAVVNSFAQQSMSVSDRVEHTCSQQVGSTRPADALRVRLVRTGTKETSRPADPDAARTCTPPAHQSPRRPRTSRPPTQTPTEPARHRHVCGKHSCVAGLVPSHGVQSARRRPERAAAPRTLPVPARAVCRTLLVPAARCPCPCAACAAR